MTQKEEYSLFYNTSAIHERRKYDTSATQVRNECYTNDLSSARVPNFDFDSDFKERNFHTTILAIWQMKEITRRGTILF